jgi:predicted transcriptional regulator
LRRIAALSACLILLAFSVSLIAIAYPQSSLPHTPLTQDAGNSQQFIFSVPLMVGASLHNNSNILNQPTRHEIYNCVKSNPGIHFRGICNNIDLSIGVVQYHLNVLTHAGLLQVYNDGQCRRYFEADAYATSDMQTVSLLRHDTTRKILTILSQNNAILHKNLAQALGLSSQALTWQMNQLKQTGLIEAKQEGMSVNYSLKKENAAALKLLLNLISSSIKHI